MGRIPTQTQRRFGCHLALRALVGGVLLLALTVSSAWATHFRYGHITSKPVASPANTVDFTVQSVWRRDAYGQGPGMGATYGNQAPPNNTFAENACVDVNRVRINCTGPNGYAGVGDIIFEGQGNTVFEFGDNVEFGTTITPSDGTGLLYW